MNTKEMIEAARKARLNLIKHKGTASERLYRNEFRWWVAYYKLQAGRRK